MSPMGSKDLFRGMLYVNFGQFVRPESGIYNAVRGGVLVKCAMTGQKWYVNPDKCRLATVDEIEQLGVRRGVRKFNRKRGS